MSEPGTTAFRGIAALAGHFVLQPGQSESITGTRPIAGAGLLSQLLKGHHFAATQARLGHVFTLCAHAHQRASALAFAAAWPADTQEVKPQPLPLALLRWETARDHLRSIALEWPLRLNDPSLQLAAMEWLRTCPVSMAGTAQPSVHQSWADLSALNTWLEANASFARQCLARWSARGKNLAVPLRTLHVLNDDAVAQQHHLRCLGEAIATVPGFTQTPQWQGACAETGPWTRLRHARETQASNLVSTEARLAARWQELLDIAAAPALKDDATQDPLLSSGAQVLGHGEAIAWCEMARGLLFHWVQLDSHGAVAQYRVLAPTEWNFHPQGALAQVLSSCHAHDTVAAQTLSAAFDPCVECSVVALPPQEPSHA